MIVSFGLPSTSLIMYHLGPRFIYVHQQGYDNIATISGIGKLLSRFGAIMAIIFLILLVKSSKVVNSIYQTSSGWLLIAVMIGAMVSYDLWIQPAIMIFWLFGVWSIGTKRNYE